MLRRWFLCAALCLGGASASAQAPETRVRMTFRGLRSSSGTVRCLLFASPEGFPDRSDKAQSYAVVSIRDRTAVCDFGGMAPGTYAVTAFHDENANERLDTNWMGIPKEGIAASQDARATMGPPRWRDAQFNFRGGSLELAARMFY